MIKNFGDWRLEIGDWRLEIGDWLLVLIPLFLLQLNKTCGNINTDRQNRGVKSIRQKDMENI